MTTQKDDTFQALSNWIDTSVIAEALVDIMEDLEIEVDFENGQQIWLRALENLYHELGSIASSYVNSIEDV